MYLGRKNQIGKPLFGFILLTFILFGFTLYLSGCTPKDPHIIINKTKFELELANTQEKRQKGLMFRESLDKNKGMLFIFNKEDIYPFWMKNTPIPLDIIWINQNLHVVDIKHNTTPLSKTPLTPKKIARYVLEINAGLSHEYEIRIGNKVTLSF